MSLRKAAELALDALLPHKSTILRWYTPVDRAIDALLQALSVPDPKPYGYVSREDGKFQREVPSDINQWYTVYRRPSELD